jgi:hypothetical protein
MLALPTEAPHLICFSEHHLKEHELKNTHIPKYKLGTNYCRQNLRQGGVCIYIHEIVKFTNIDLLKHNKEQDIEVAAIQLKIQKVMVIILCIYRAPCGNFNYFLNKLEIILNSLHKPNLEFIICDDININYLESNNKKTQLDNLLGTYNLTDTVFFSTRIVNNTATLIDNIFIDNRRNYSITPCLNGLSDHDGQLLTLLNLPIPHNSTKYIYKRRIDNNTIADFQLQLSYEQWEDVFGKNNVNEIFDSFLNTYLRCYHSSFTKKVIKTQHNYEQWITKGIKTSCKRKRELLILCRHSNDLNLKNYYKRYCKLLTKVISAAKRLHYNRIILNSKNKMVTTWKIINYENGKSNYYKNIQSFMSDKEVITNQNAIANIFNNYFLTITDTPR